MYSYNDLLNADLWLPFGLVMAVHRGRTFGQQVTKTESYMIIFYVEYTTERVD